MSVLNVEYRLAPENRHPTQVNDAFEAIKWAAENAPLLRADLKKGFILGGLSAGGHLTAVLAHRVRDDPFFKDRPVTGHVIQFPAVLHPDAYPEEYKDRLLSYQQNKNAPILSWESVVWLWHQFLDGTGISPSDPEVSPLLYPSHEGLSPVIIQVAGLDPLRDEALLYDQVLRKAGVKTRTITYPGVPHGFNYVFGSMKAASKFEEDYRDGLRWLLASADN
ncbi:Alpha/Beta hydrolase protein [Mycena amicta]|nr:Alpha/Beta hydrolase protein [Mycena amicta]